MGVPLSLIVTVPFEGFVVVKVPVVGISLSFAIMSIDTGLSSLVDTESSTKSSIGKTVIVTVAVLQSPELLHTV